MVWLQNQAFGNAIGVEGGKLTGNFFKTLEITPQKKSRLINWLATMEKVPEEEVLKFGLTPNGQGNDKKAKSSQYADLKICMSYDYEQLVNYILDKKLSVSQVIAVLIVIGMQESQILAVKKLTN